MSKPLNEMTIQELKAFTLAALRRSDRAAIEQAKAETLARVAVRIGDGTATDELCRKASLLAMKG